ncbi:hypothetical protein [Catellatospora chokoriensis]|uniref:Uncharacterized protein n=1 Tax=Catellatospora chokoriensis TaxID=310353 RepID=A0A8J3NS12_9ACTN|nr:hypothetical protein [Catellatospora chokoriensis]GIF89998.1 hypothetical protein Cch02nite_34420 [Catellatospora chokoriensis]
MTYADVVGTLALILSVLAIGVQIFQWVRSGHRIAVNPSGSWVLAWEPSTLVRVNNRGRAPVDVVEWGFDYPRSSTYSGVGLGRYWVENRGLAGYRTTFPAETVNVQLPKRLEPGQELQLTSPPDVIPSLQEMMRENIPWVRPFVRLGDGSTVKARGGNARITIHRGSAPFGSRPFRNSDSLLPVNDDLPDRQPGV